MKTVSYFIILLSFTSLLIGCSYIKSKSNVSAAKNQCINIKRQQMYLKTQYGQTEVSQIQTQNMNLQREYDNSSCDQVIAKEL